MNKADFIDTKPDMQAIAKRVLQVQADALLRTQARIDGAFERAVDCLLQHSGKLVVLGIGKSGLIGQKLAATFCSTGTPSVFLHAAEAVHGDLGIYHPGDPTLFISKSGSTAELIRLIPSLKEFSSPLLGILGNMNSPMARTLDIVLDTSVAAEADPLGIVPTTSTTAAIAMGDALAVALMVARGFSEVDFARYHPAGQLGRNLQLKVEDLLHPIHHVARVRPETNLKDIVIALSEYPLGAACVLDANEGLVGLITDGDIRRCLRHHDDIRGVTARDIMTAQPTYTFPNVALAQAVKQMEDRPSQITVLPVLNPQTKCCLGLLRLHDAYQPQL